MEHATNYSGTRVEHVWNMCGTWAEHDAGRRSARIDALEAPRGLTIWFWRLPDAEQRACSWPQSYISSLWELCTGACWPRWAHASSLSRRQSTPTMRCVRALTCSTHVPLMFHPCSTHVPLYVVPCSTLIAFNRWNPNPLKSPTSKNCGTCYELQWTMCGTCVEHVWNMGGT